MHKLFSSLHAQSPAQIEIHVPISNSLTHLQRYIYKQTYLWSVLGRHLNDGYNTQSAKMSGSVCRLGGCVAPSLTIQLGRVHVGRV